MAALLKFINESYIGTEDEVPPIFVSSPTQTPTLLLR